MIDMRMDRPEEVLLSYLCGLAPIGEAFDVRIEELQADLGLKFRPQYNKLLDRLLDRKAVERIRRGGGRGQRSMLAVLKRPEQVQFNPPPPQRKVVTWRDPAAKEAALHG